MTALIASEVRKLTTVRTTWVLTGVGLALVALGTALFVFVEQFTGPFSGTDAEVAAAVDQIGSNAVIVLVVAILMVSTEFRHGTIGRTLQLVPSRTRVLASKVVTGALYGVLFFVLGLVVVAVVLVIGQLVKDASPDIGSETLTSLWQGPLGLLLNAILGVAIGALLRSQVVAITITLVWLFVVENLVNALLPEIARWLPFQVLNAVFLSDEVLENMPEGSMRVLPLDPPVALAVFLGYVAVAIVAAGILMRKRDV